MGIFDEDLVGNANLVEKNLEEEDAQKMWDDFEGSSLYMFNNLMLLRIRCCRISRCG